jgi:hypothetical protein
MRILIVAVAAIVFLGGLLTEQGVRGASDLPRDLRDKQVSAVLNQEVSVPPGRARLFMQAGNVVGAKDF